MYPLFYGKAFTIEGNLTHFIDGIRGSFGECEIFKNFSGASETAGKPTWPPYTFLLKVIL